MELFSYHFFFQVSFAFQLILLLEAIKIPLPPIFKCQNLFYGNFKMAYTSHVNLDVTKTRLAWNYFLTIFFSSFFCFSANFVA